MLFNWGSICQHLTHAHTHVVLDLEFVKQNFVFLETLQAVTFIPSTHVTVSTLAYTSFLTPSV